MTIAALIPGGLLAMTLFAIAGATFLQRRWMLAGAIGLLIETMFVFTIAPLTLLAGLGFLWLSRRMQTDAAAVLVGHE